jgi:hypothetical protein
VKRTYLEFKVVRLMRFLSEAVAIHRIVCCFQTRIEERARGLAGKCFFFVAEKVVCDRFLDEMLADINLCNKRNDFWI